MKLILSKRAIFRFATLVSIMIPCFAYSQGIAFFRTTKKQSGEEKKIPTVITSNSLEIDIENNKAIFLEHVRVNDQELIIECDKMTIHLEANNGNPVAGVELSTTNQKAPAKQISRIVCEGNVIITRKLPVSVENPEPVQKAFAGHADYDVKTGMIVMTKDPVLKRGDDSLKGEIITIWRDSEKVSVKHGVTLELKSENVKDAQNAGDEKIKIKDEKANEGQ